jgi:sortase A
MRLARFLGFIGRACITLGVLILLFVAYQLWGTGIRTAQAQDDLEKEFKQDLAAAATSTTTPVTEPGTVPPLAPVPEGEATAQIVVPKIGIDWTVVEGVTLKDLKKGPGHYPQTPLPGQEGNAGIAGHRTTHGAPFNRIDELKPGDDIYVTTVQGRFHYIVTDTEGDGDGHLIVKPTQVEVLKDFGDNRLTMSACNPKYSAKERIIVVSELAPEEKALPAPPPSKPPAAIDDIDGEPEDASVWPTIFWGVVCALIWLLAWLVGRRLGAPAGEGDHLVQGHARRRRWLAYIVGFPFFMVALFFFFEALSRLLPSTI